MKPEIKNLKWEGNGLVTVPIRLLNAVQYDMGLDKIDKIVCNETIDLSKLAIIRYVYTKGIDSEILKNECMITIGEEEHIILISRENMLKVWLYFKNNG